MDLPVAHPCSHQYALVSFCLMSQLVGSKIPRLPGDHFSTSRWMLHPGSASIEVRWREGPGSRVGVAGSRAYSLDFQSGFQPTCEPTGFQPVERQFKDDISAS